MEQTRADSEYRFTSEANGEAERFSTKAELLKHIGKNEKDNKLVDRMIAKGIVRKESGMYVLVDKDSELERANNEIERLKKEIEKLKADGQQGTNTLGGKEEGNNTLIAQLKEEIKGLNSDLDFQMKEYERLERESKVEIGMYQECIRKCYLWAVNEKKVKITRPDFRDNVLKLKKELPGEGNQ